MSKKRFACRDCKINYSIQCEEISDNGNWITYGQIVDLLNEQSEKLSEQGVQIDFLKDENQHMREVLEENKQLKSELNNCRNCLELNRSSCAKYIKENLELRQVISKIDFAIIRKYDNSLENLFDEVYDSEYNNWIKKQVARGKQLNRSDME